MKTVLSFMGEDHNRLDRLFQDFKNAQSADKSRARNLFYQFKTGLQRHIVWEEEILFPLFETKTGMHDAGPTAVMRMEHRKIKDFLEKISGIFSKNVPTNDLEEGLIKVLTEHNDKEESILYPWIDNSMSESEIAKIVGVMENQPLD